MPAPHRCAEAPFEPLEPTHQIVSRYDASRRTDPFPRPHNFRKPICVVLQATRVPPTIPDQLPRAEQKLLTKKGSITDSDLGKLDGRLTNLDALAAADALAAVWAQLAASEKPGKDTIVLDSMLREMAGHSPRRAADAERAGKRVKKLLGKERGVRAALGSLLPGCPDAEWDQAVKLLGADCDDYNDAPPPAPSPATHITGTKRTHAETGLAALASSSPLTRMPLSTVSANSPPRPAGGGEATLHPLSHHIERLTFQKGYQAGLGQAAKDYKNSVTRSEYDILEKTFDNITDKWTAEIITLRSRLQELNFTTEFMLGDAMKHSRLCQPADPRAEDPPFCALDLRDCSESEFAAYRSHVSEQHCAALTGFEQSVREAWARARAKFVVKKAPTVTPPYPIE